MCLKGPVFWESETSRQENKDRLLVIMAVLFFGLLGLSEFILKKEGSSVCRTEGVSAAWNQRKNWRGFLVFFRESPHATQGISGSLPVFYEQLFLFALLLQCERVSRGLTLGVSYQRWAKRSGVLVKKVFGGIRLACWCPYELILQKGSWSKYYENFSGRSCAGSQTEKLAWSFLALTLFLAWSLSAGPWLLVFILLAILYSSAFKMNSK